MANVIVTTNVKYRVSRRGGTNDHKEVEQHFERFEQTINLSEDNFFLLKAFISGMVDAADGEVE